VLIPIPTGIGKKFPSPALGDSPHEEALVDWLPDAWQKHQQASAPSAVTLPA
jgi:hypothetical protein